MTKEISYDFIIFGIDIIPKKLTISER